MSTKSDDQDTPILPDPNLMPLETPPGVDRRAFLMRSALVGSVAVLNGCKPATPEAGAPPAPTPAPAAAAPAAPPSRRSSRS